MALKNITTPKKLRGNMIRSEARWVEEGEKPTNYFCHLKSRNFLNNTIKKVEVPEKGVILISLIYLLIVMNLNTKI